MFTLPFEAKALMTFLLVAGIKALFAQFKVDIAGKGALIVAGFVGAVVFFIESFLQTLTPEAQQTVVAILGAVATILGAFGIHYTVKETVVGGLRGNALELFDDTV